MEAFLQEWWDWFGRELALFGVHWLVVVLPLCGFGGFVGWRYRKLNREIRELKERLVQPPAVQTVTVNTHGGGLDKFQTYDPEDGTLYFGTVYGDMQIRLHRGEDVRGDISNWLHRNKLLGPLSPEAAKGVFPERIAIAQGDKVRAFREAETRWLHQPGVGREAARLIMTAPTLEEARAVHDTFMVTDPRLDASWAHWSYLYRLNMEDGDGAMMGEAERITLSENTCFPTGRQGLLELPV